MDRSRLTLTLCVVFAVFCGWLDIQTAEVIYPVAAIAFSACGLTLLVPSRWWLWALLTGISVPIAHLIVRWTGMPLPYPVPSILETLLAFIPAFLGALFGRTFPDDRSRRGNA